MTALVGVRELFAEHYLHLVRLAASLVDDLDSAEDVVQDVFAAVQRKPLPQDPRRYLVASVVNRSRSVLRRRRTVRLAPVDRPVDHEPADTDALRRDGHARIRAAIRTLPTRQREVVVLRYFEELTVTETAELLGIRKSAVSASLNRALTSLRPLLEGDHR